MRSADVAVWTVWVFLNSTTPAGAETLIKHSKHGAYPAAWTDYHGYHGKKDQLLQDLKEAGKL